MIPSDLDLRLHKPRPDVVIVRVIGTVDSFGASLLAQRVGAQLNRAGHVVIDLGGVSVLGPARPGGSPHAAPPGGGAGHRATHHQSRA